MEDPVKKSIDLCAHLIFQILLRRKGPAPLDEVYQELAEEVLAAGPSRSAFDAAALDKKFVILEKYIDLSCRNLSPDVSVNQAFRRYFEAGLPLTKAQLFNLLRSFKLPMEPDHLRELIDRTLSSGRYFKIAGELYGAEFWFEESRACLEEFEEAQEALRGWRPSGEDPLEAARELLAALKRPTSAGALLRLLKSLGFRASGPALFKAMFNRRDLFEMINGGRWLPAEELASFWEEPPPSEEDVVKAEEEAYDASLIEEGVLDDVRRDIIANKRPVTVDEIIRSRVGPLVGDERYEEMFRNISYLLSADGRFVRVSEKEWFLFELLPENIFDRPAAKQPGVKKSREASAEGGIEEVEGEDELDFALPSPASDAAGGRKNIWRAKLRSSNLEKGCLRRDRLGILPEEPIICRVEFTDHRGKKIAAWLNNDSGLIWGLENWFEDVMAKPGDAVALSLTDEGGPFIEIIYGAGGSPEPKKEAGPRGARRGKTLVEEVVAALKARPFGLEENKLIAEVLRKRPDASAEAILSVLSKFSFFYRSGDPPAWKYKGVREKAVRSSEKLRFSSEEDLERTADLLGSYEGGMALEIKYLLDQAPEEARPSLLRLARDVARYPKLSQNQELELLSRAKGGDKEAQNIIIKTYLKQIWGSVARNLKIWDHLGHDMWDRFEDAFNEGVLGLIYNIKAFDPTKSPRLYQYFLPTAAKIKYNLTRERYWWCYLPRHAADVMLKLEEHSWRAAAAGPTQDLAEEPPISLNVSESASKELSWVMKAELLSFEQLLEENEDFAPEGYASDPAERVEENLGERLALRESFKLLNDREKAILHLRFGLAGGREHTLEEIGRAMGLTRERIRQLEAKALKQLSRNLKEIYRNH